MGMRIRAEKGKKIGIGMGKGMELGKETRMRMGIRKRKGKETGMGMEVWMGAGAHSSLSLPSPAVVRGTIHSVSNDAELQESVIGVSAVRIHRQKFPLFQTGGRPGRAVGSIRTPLRCGVRPGPGTFLFTGWLHFGEAWLSCAPRYKDFQRIYEGARRRRQNPCEFPVD